MEINKRVNYPIKKVLVDMQNTRIIETEDRRNPIHCYCVSWFSIRVANIGTSTVVAAWNEHPIPGVSNEICTCYHSFKVGKFRRERNTKHKDGK